MFIVIHAMRWTLKIRFLFFFFSFSFVPSEDTGKSVAECRKIKQKGKNDQQMRYYYICQYWAVSTLCTYTRQHWNTTKIETKKHRNSNDDDTSTFQINYFLNVMGHHSFIHSFIHFDILFWPCVIQWKINFYNFCNRRRRTNMFIPFYCLFAHLNSASFLTVFLSLVKKNW